MIENDDAPSLVQYVEVGGAWIAFSEHRPSSDPAETPLVLLHGGSLDHRMWHRQLQAFGSRRLIALDARGHGWTTAPDPAAFRHCDDVIAALDALGIESAVLAGVSMGASTAVDAALEHPGRMAGVIACGAGTSQSEFRDPWVLGILAEWQRAAEAHDPEAWIAAALKFVAGPHRELEDLEDAILQEVDIMIRHTLFTHIVGPSGPVMPRPPTPVTRISQRLPGLDVPVLGIVGEQDAEDHLRMVRELVSAVPAGQLRVIPNTAHYPNLERPEEFNQVLGEFLVAVEDT
ncbi:alpha/beta fold hydrolase [Nesterenkonia muleiensis]|uniref:alpha/beta fold hydrolase n=1 Tax=Nesterenkonia muleiensis TaxID=2282648 RepID=UPI00130056B3|nr:alpha/beta hydrolase [Nesterenkonia muleiensis]